MNFLLLDEIDCLECPGPVLGLSFIGNFNVLINKRLEDDRLNARSANHWDTADEQLNHKKQQIRPCERRNAFEVLHLVKI